MTTEKWAEQLWNDLVALQNFQRKLLKMEKEIQEKEWIECPECGTKYEKGCEDRVEAGMKCGLCAYGVGGNGKYMTCKELARLEEEYYSKEEEEKMSEKEWEQQERDSHLHSV